MDTEFLRNISVTTVMLRDIIIRFTCNGLFFLERMVIILALKLYSLLRNVDKSALVRVIFVCKNRSFISNKHATGFAHLNMG
jgi:hypothetical protein